MIDSIEMELMEIRHVYVEKSEALEAFDQGEYVFDSPERGMMVPVRRSDISDADEGTFFRMQREEWKNYKNVQAEMDLVPAVTSIKEARLLLMQENSFGTIRQLNTIRANLQSKLSEIKNAAEISYGSWDSDARNAYNSVITNIERELNSIINEINTLKMYVYKEEEL